MKKALAIASLLALYATASLAGDKTITMQALTAAGDGATIGTVVASETEHGVVLTPALSGLTPGIHGFHLHQNPSCAAAEKDGKTVPGLAAGGHYDPADTKRHDTPWGNGHLGDLPALTVDAEGKATLPVLAPRLKLADMAARSLMIHAGGDNYSDEPNKLGGGGARAACGVIE